MIYANDLLSYWINWCLSLQQWHCIYQYNSDLDLDKEITHLDHDVEVTEQFRSNDMKLIQHKGDLFCLEAMTKQRHEKKENQKFQVFSSIQT